MEPRPPVVVGYDGSGRSDVALRWAAREAEARGLPLRLVTVAPSVPPSGVERPSSTQWHPDDAQVISDRGRRLAAVLVVDSALSSAVVSGPPASVLARESLAATLVVVGQRRQDRPVSSAVGSVSVVLAARAACPVVVVRGASGAERAHLPVAVAAPHDVPCPGALDFAAREAACRHVPLTIVTSWSLPTAHHWAPATDDVAHRSRQLEDRATSSNQAAEEWVRRHHPVVRTRTLVVRGEAVGALAEASRRAGLVVVAAPASDPGTTPPGGTWPGTVVNGVLGWSACPVVVVPAMTPAPTPGGLDRRDTRTAATHPSPTAG